MLGNLWSNNELSGVRVGWARCQLSGQLKWLVGHVTGILLSVTVGCTCCWCATYGSVGMSDYGFEPLTDRLVNKLDRGRVVYLAN